MKLTGKVALSTNVSHFMGPAITYFPPALTGDPVKLERMLRNIPAGRLARSEEPARLAAYLASDDADFFVGQVIPFAGGWVTP